MNNILELKRKRFQFLHRLYEESEGNELAFVNMYELGKDIGFTQQETMQVMQYLGGENLAKHRTKGGGISITHWGVVQVEAALSEPEQSTQYFPPVNIINIQRMENSQIQQGTIESTQTQLTDQIDREAIIEFIQRLRQQLPQLDMDAEARSEAEAEIATVEAQVISPRPKARIIRECLQTVRNLLEGIAGNIIAAQLLTQIGPLIR